MAVKYLEKKIAKWTIDIGAEVSVEIDAADINETLDVITSVNHPFKTGDMVSPRLKASTGVTATVPAIGTAYYVIYLTADTFALATSLALAKAGTKTALTAGSAADVILAKNCYGRIYSGVVIPNKALVTSAYYVVETLFESSDGQGKDAANADAATIAIGIAAADDLLAAIDISGVTTAGKFGTLVGSPVFGGCGSLGSSALLYAGINAASWLLMAADNELTVSIAGGDPMFVGKIHIYVEYVV